VPDNIWRGRPQG